MPLFLGGFFFWVVIPSFGMNCVRLKVGVMGWEMEGGVGL